MGGQTFVRDDAPIVLECLAAEELARLTTAIVADSLDAVGLRHQVVQPGVSACWAGARLVGRATTVQFAPTEEDGPDPYREFMEFMDSLDAGSVPVLATGGDTRTAYWGELFSAAALGRKAAGTICDGPVRDVEKIHALGYPVFSAGSRPVDFRARMRVVDRDQPVRFAGVLISPGDIVVADRDGLVVLPRSVEPDVLALAVKRASAEGTVLGELIGGASLSEVWQRWGVL